MRVIFLKDVPKVGRKNEVKEVSSGYAQNFLLPRKLVEVASDGKVAKLAQDKQKSLESKEKAKEAFKARLSSVKGVTVTMRAQANDQGALFKGIHPAEVSKALKTQTGMDVPEDALVIETIKHVGEYTVGVEGEGINASFKLAVERI